MMILFRIIKVLFIQCIINLKIQQGTLTFEVLVESGNSIMLLKYTSSKYVATMCI